MLDQRRTTNRPTKALVLTACAIALVALVSATVLANPTSSKDTKVELRPGIFAPEASGEITFGVRSGVLSGQIDAEGLPAQGVHAFYVLWFVRADTGDKAFLGPVVHDDSILFLTGGDAEMHFRASAFTDGPGKGSAISLGSAGSNFFVLIAEKQIDTFQPFPVSPPPTSFALMATF